jgi:hypothetical protein
MPGDAVYGFALIAIAACISLIYVVRFRPSRSVSTSRPRRYYRTPLRPEKKLTPDLTDPAQQLHAVMAASFERRQLLNRSEYRVFKIIEDDIAAACRGYRVFAQTSLGEVLTTPNENGFRSIIDENGFRSINSKRVDILIVDRGGWPAVAVEYQGSGHYQGTAAARDAVKKEALRKAGVRYMEVSASDSATQIRSRIREQLGWETV